MFYELQVRLIFPKKEDAEKLADFLSTQFAKTAIIKPGQASQERSVMYLVQTHHEETPPAPSLIIASWP